MSKAGLIGKLPDIRRFLVAGNSKFTLVSKRSGNRWTFQTERPKNPTTPGPVFFVSLLVGQDNQSDYKYIAFLRETDFGLRLTQNKERWGAEAYATLEWLVRQLNNYAQVSITEVPALDSLAIQNRFNANAEFWHSGRCSKCGRELTDPQSIELGIGPVCGGRQGAKDPSFHGDVDTDNLPPGDVYGDQ